MKPNKLLVFMAIGFELVALVLVAVWAGNWIDNKYGTGGMGMMGAIVLALAGWIVHIVSLVKQVEKE